MTTEADFLKIVGPYFSIGAGYCKIRVGYCTILGFYCKELQSLILLFCMLNFQLRFLVVFT